MIYIRNIPPVQNADDAKRLFDYLEAVVYLLAEQRVFPPRDETVDDEIRTAILLSAEIPKGG